MSQDILDTLRALISERFDLPADELDVHADFASLGVDSLGLMDFIFEVEDRYKVVIDYEKAMAKPNLSGLAELVHSLCEAGAVTAE